MEKSTKLIIIGLTAAGLAAYLYNKSKQPLSVPLGGLSVNMHPNYFRRLAKEREKQYKHAIGEIKKLEAANEDMWNQLQEKANTQFSNKSTSTYGGIFGGGYGAAGGYGNGYGQPHNLPSQPQPQLSNVNQMIDDAESESEDADEGISPNMNVGPVVRKLNY